MSFLIKEMREGNEAIAEPQFSVESRSFANDRIIKNMIVDNPC